MQLSHQQLSISGWIHEYDQQSSPHIHQETIIIEKKCESMLKKIRIRTKQIKYFNFQLFDLIDQSRNKSQILKPPRVPTNQNKIQELKKVMEFLQHNEQYKYDTHRIFNLNDPKFQPEIQQIIEQKKEQFKIRLNQQQNKRILQPLQEINSTNPITDRQQQSKTNNQFKRTRLKTDQNLEIQKSNSIHRIQSIKDIMPKILKPNETPGILNKQVIQKGLEFLQLMIDRHKENVQHCQQSKRQKSIK
ncbi:unnamed protein product [Paramecium primaurelia]|uniref:Uncharacterized protein n=1 Tax=Paramecium primaurelia TaxID=5886 RepID=A0A8S1N6A3_PARPR|nr:unnamed protein product [Paramecium primaurelia]